MEDNAQKYYMRIGKTKQRQVCSVNMISISTALPSSLTY